MSRRSFLSLWDELPEYHSLLGGLQKGFPEQALFGLQPGQVAFLLAALREETSRPLLIITPGHRETVLLADALASWLPDETVLPFPPLEVVPYNLFARSPEIVSQRLQVLVTLLRGGAGVVVASVDSVLRSLVPVESFRAAVFPVRSGEEAPPERVMERLLAGGYERVERVEGPGQFGFRGGILDIHPLTEDRPRRIDYFGDRVESLRIFDSDSQRSLEEVPFFLVTPARETVLSGNLAGKAAANLRREVADQAARLEKAGRAAEARLLHERVSGHLAGMTASLWELYLPYICQPVSILDYFTVPPMVIWHEAARGLDSVAGASRHWLERSQSLLEEGRLLPLQQRLMLSADEWKAAVRKHQILYMAGFPVRLPGTEPRNVLSFSGKPVPSFQGQWELFHEELRGLRERKYRVCLTTSNPERKKRLIVGLTEKGLDPVRTETGPDGTDWLLPSPGGVAVFTAALTGGFIHPTLRLAVLTEQEISGRRRRARTLPRKGKGMRISTYQDLKVGDYVVHVQHGIGRYLGIKTMEVQATQRDYLYIRYKGADRLYVPTDQIDLIQKYVGGEAPQPRLNKLGGNEWARVKERIKESVRKMAQELLDMYAARQALEGYAFGPDTVWQKEFEDAFPYEETEDQLRSIAEIKEDMEQSRPMDRLLCGDVGFGKTEVAMRAAFKAVMAGKQVSVLVPTTILAQQHHLTFKERFRGFPVRIEVLSRFRTAKQQSAVITGLRKGEVDLVIGTHRLLGADVNFRDLGLLIIDEEHRFGVSHKESLKRIRATVDVLTLTATPIPRTLHMSMAGLRDISVINTPPENRFPIETYVVEHDEQLVRDALERETGRGGQVFYVHNRVQTIALAHRRLQGLVPGVRITVAHGRMPADELEDVMMAFLDGRYDVLLCTSIIESGLDIPNANTLIVEDSDRFGLAQLYQIRGRVGRSHRLAYAYFTFRREKILGEAAEKRLTAIKEFTELGSGFKIALRDLEIRGAGNILGPEQHGFVASVGFDLYCQLLDDAVRSLRGERAVPGTEPAIELAVDAFLEDGYIGEGRAKIEVYKRVNAAGTPEEVLDLEEELKDRYGPIPPPARNLLDMALIRIKAADLGLLGVTHDRDMVRFLFPLYMKDLLHKIYESLRPDYGRRLSVQLSQRPALRLKFANLRRPLWETGGKGGMDAGEQLLKEVKTLLDTVGGISEVRKWKTGNRGAADAGVNDGRGEQMV